MSRRCRGTRRWRWAAGRGWIDRRLLGRIAGLRGPIVRAEGNAAPPTRGTNPVERALAKECARRDDTQLVLAGLAALLGLVAGAVALTPNPNDGSHSKVDALVG